MYKQKNIIYYSLFILTYSLLLYKAIFNTLTYDEAQTFLNYVLTKDIFNFGIANNHPLNSFLIILSTNINFKEINIRFPAIFFGAVYFYLSLLVSIKIKRIHFVFPLLILNPYLFEFFTLARGYGISASLIFLALYLEYFTKLKYKFYINLFILVISSYSIYITVIFTFLYIFYYVVFEKKYNKIFFSISFLGIIFSIPSIYLTNQITVMDRNLYGIYEYELLKVFNFGILPLFNPEQFILSFLTFVLLIMNLSFKKIIINKNMNILFLSTFLLLYLLPIAFQKPLPQLRVLVPFLPIFFLFLILNSKNKIIIEIITSIILLINFITTFNLNNTFDWNTTPTKSEILTIYYDDEGKCYFYYFNNPVEEYYRLLNYGNKYENCYLDK